MTANLRFILKTTLLSGVLFLQACGYFYEIPEQPIDPSANAEKLESRSLDSPVVAEALDQYELAHQGNQDWTLDQLTVAAWTLRSDIPLARARLEAARSATEVAALRPIPTLNTNGEAVVSNSSSPWVLGAGLGLLFQPGNKLEIRRQRALAEERILENVLGGTLWSVFSEVRQASLQNRFTGDLLALDREELDLRRAYQEWVETRLALGAANSQDRLQSAQALSLAENQERSDQANLVSASVRLAAFVGIAQREIAGISLDIPSLQELPAGLVDDLDEAKDLALSNRLDIRQALNEYDVAEQELRQAVAAQYPDLNFGPGYLFDQGDHKITLNLSLPLALKNNNRVQIDNALANRQVAASNFDKVQSDALAVIESSFALYQSMRDTLDAAIQSENVAEMTVQTTRQLLDAGAANRGDMLGAEILLVQRKRDTLVARQTLFDAIGRLEDAIQRPLYPPSSLNLNSAEQIYGQNP